MSMFRYALRSIAGRHLAEPRDRRLSCRYPVLCPDAALGWWSESAFLDVPARLVDLSLKGCMLVLTQNFARVEGQPVWLCPLELPTAVWTEGVVLSVRKPLVQLWQIRIAFLAEFPYDLFKELVFGREHLRDVSRGPAPDHEQDHYWR